MRQEIGHGVNDGFERRLSLTGFGVWIQAAVSGILSTIMISADLANVQSEPSLPRLSSPCAALRRDDSWCIEIGLL